MQKTCPQCHLAFDVTADDLAFLDNLSPEFGGKKELIPPPTLCPDCRQQRRAAQPNHIHLYRRICDLTGASIMSNIHPDAPYKVYRQSEWYSDKWDPLSYGRPFDPSRPFFPQFQELSLAVPRPNLFTGYEYDENAEYTNHAGKNKDCYLLFDSDENRDCYYSYSINGCVSCSDCFRTRQSELSFQCVDCVKCYNTVFAQDSSGCWDCAFVKNCIGCKNCFFCSNLRNKENWIENKPASKEEVARLRASLASHDEVVAWRKKFDVWKLGFPQKYMHGLQNENVHGDYLVESKNADHCFDCEKLWDCRHIYQGFMKLKDCAECQECGDGERLYECTTVGYSAYGMSFCSSCLSEIADLLYCMHCFHCKHCFGCVGLRKKQYCVFNVQLTKETYGELVPKIIAHMRRTGEWGEFFPVTLSLFAYNETLAQEYFPLTKEEILRRGWPWRDEIDEVPQVTRVIPALQLPPSIDDIPDDILHWAIRCETTERPYKIIKQELQFYRNQRLPVPRLHPDERLKQRMAMRNPRKVWDRQCDNCRKPIETSYAPERPEKILCEECYLKEVS
jgi:hypothetical protein